MDLSSLFPLIIDEGENGTRLDQILSQRFPMVSRSRWKALIEGELFTADAKVLKSSAKLKAGQRIEIDLAAAQEILRHKTVWETREFRGPEPSVLFENKNYLVINKPCGLAVHPGAGIEAEETLVAWLLKSERLQNVDPQGRVAWGDSVLEDERPGIVHRLDRGTSGALVIAKDPQTHRILAQQFEERSAGRVYLAMVRGSLSQAMNEPQSLFRKKMRESATHLALHWNRGHKVGRFVSYLARDPVRRTNFRVESGPVGRVASTDFQEILEAPPCTLIALKLGTGRTHQIRVHLNFMGLPIVGDGLYGGGRLPDKSEDDATFLLHARCLYLKDPQSGVERFFDAPLPEHYLSFLTKSGVGAEDQKRVLEMSWTHWNSTFRRAGAED